MGKKAAAIRAKLKANRNTLPIQNVNDPYSHLAVSIIIQAFEDLKYLDGQDRCLIDGGTVSQREIMRFFQSGWCALLLSCQRAITQEGLETAAKSIL